MQHKIKNAYNLLGMLLALSTAASSICVCVLFFTAWHFFLQETHSARILAEESQVLGLLKISSCVIVPLGIFVHAANLIIDECRQGIWRAVSILHFLLFNISCFATVLFGQFYCVKYLCQEFTGFVWWLSWINA
jgi:hypothetical protein